MPTDNREEDILAHKVFEDLLFIELGAPWDVFFSC